MTRAPIRRLALMLALLALIAAAPGFALAQSELSGTVVVTLLDQNGALLPGGCFTVSSNAGAVSFSCDAYDGSADGTTTITHVPPGSYDVFEYHLPPGYFYDTQGHPVTVQAGQVATVTIQPQPGGASVAVTTLDQQGKPLPGACYSVYVDTGGGVPGAGVGGGCDFFDGNNDGKASFGGYKDGNYIVVSSTTPKGQVAPDPRRVTLTSGQTAAVSETLQPGGQTVTVKNVDQRGRPVYGFCFRVYKDAGNGQRGGFVEVSCDSYYDGKVDGIITLGGLLPGNYVLVQPGPLPGFTAAPDQPFVVQPGQDLTLTVTTARTAATPSASPASSPAAAGAFAVGTIVTVTVGGVNLRAQPSTSGNVVATLSAGQQLTIAGAPQTADGYTWYPVKAANGAQGYVVETFLQAG